MKMKKSSRFDFLNTRKKKLKSNRSGIMQLPFGMIFSIILIAAFIAVAIYAILMFLDTQECAKAGIFKEDLQEELNKAWTGDETSTTFEGNLPGNIEFVCFADLESEGKGSYTDLYDSLKKYGYVNVNMFYYPLKEVCKGQRTADIKHLDIKKITEKENPYCVKSENSKVGLKVEKGFYDALVNVS